MKYLRRNQRGETIVEVLITVAALSLVLTLSYGLANRSTLAVRQSQERGEAFKIAQAQLERFKYYISIPSPGVSVPPVGTAFCMVSDPAGTLLPPIGLIGDKVAPVTLPAANAAAHDFGIFQTTSPNCISGDVDYNSYIVREDAGTYTSHVRWSRITGTGLVDESTMVYRMYPDCTVGGVGC